MPRRLALVLAAALLAAPAGAQTGAEFAETQRIRAQVLTIDPEAGQVLLRNLDTGEVFVHQAPQPITGRIGAQPGDVVAAVYTRGATVRPAGPGDRAVTETERIVVPATADGAAAFVGGKLTRSVITLTRWDPEASVAHGTTPEGETVSHPVRTPEGRAFMAEQQPGARLEVELSETVVIRKE